MAYLVSIIRDKTDKTIQRHKTIHRISGDVYLITPGNIMESLESHKKLFPESTATTIEEAGAYHAQYLTDLAEKRRQAAEQAAAEQEAENDELN